MIGRAGGRSGKVGDDDRVIAGIGALQIGQQQRRVGGAGDIESVLAPLITQGSLGQDIGRRHAQGCSVALRYGSWSGAGRNGYGGSNGQRVTEDGSSSNAINAVHHDVIGCPGTDVHGQNTGASIPAAVIVTSLGDEGGNNSGADGRT